MIWFCNNGQGTKTCRIAIKTQIHIPTCKHYTCKTFKMLILKARVSVNFQGFMLFVTLQYSGRIYIGDIHFWRVHVFILSSCRLHSAIYSVFCRSLSLSRTYSPLFPNVLFHLFPRKSRTIAFGLVQFIAADKHISLAFSDKAWAGENW